MPRRISILPVLLLPLALLIASCGGADNSVAKAEFIKRAEAICIQAGRAEGQQQGKYFQQNFERLKREPPPPKNVRTVREIVRTITVPIMLKELEELEALEYPEGDEEALQGIFAGTREGAKELNAEPQLIWSSRAGNPLYPSYKAAKDYGFAACAEA